MNAKTVGMIGLGITAATGAAYLIYDQLFKKAGEYSQYMLILRATVGGYTIPNADSYNYKTPTTVTVKAVANTGYTFDGWYRGGIKMSSNLSYTFTVDRQMVLIATFLKEGAPPVIPSYLAPVKNATLEDYWKVWRIFKDIFTGDVLQIGHDFYVVNTIKFKLQDAAGNGVPNQKIALYTEMMPDATDYGYVLFVDSINPLIANGHFDFNPFIAITDSNGIVEVPMTYWHWQEGCPTEGAYCYRSSIGMAGRIHAQRIPYINEWWEGPPVWHDLYFMPPADITHWERLKNPVSYARNPVHAYWVDNPNLPVLGDAFTDCYVKVMESREF